MSQSPWVLLLLCTPPFIIVLQELCNCVLMLSSREFHLFFFHPFGKLIYVHTSTPTSLKSKEKQKGDALRCIFLFNVNYPLCCSDPWPLDYEEEKAVVPLCLSASPSPAVALSCHHWSELMASSVLCVQYSRLLRSNEQHIVTIPRVQSTVSM